MSFILNSQFNSCNEMKGCTFETKNQVSRWGRHIEAGEREGQGQEVEHGGLRLDAVIGFVFIQVTHTHTVVRREEHSKDAVGLSQVRTAVL